MDNTRSTLIDHFLLCAGWCNARREKLAGDASFRRYERVHEAGRQAVLMDAPPDKEDIGPFVQVAQELAAYGMSAPRLLAQDAQNGLLLLEDLGDDLFTRVLVKTPAREKDLYLAAAEVLVALYHRGRGADYAAYKPYDDALYMRECGLFPEWFLPAALPGASPHAGKEFMDLWQRLLVQLPKLPATLVLRDYHADNLLWLPERAHVQRVGLLDFQDAVVGSPAYDIVSFLEDARRDVEAETVDAVIAHYLAQTGLNPADFMAAYAVLGAQRNCKIIGIFARLAVRDGKTHYLAYLPRVWRHLEKDVAHPLLAPLKAWLDETITPELRGVIAV